jgi:hypothetical protein
MKHVRSVIWKEVTASMVAGFFLIGIPATGQSNEPSEDPAVRMDNRGSGSLNSGPGSVSSGSGEHSGRYGGHDIRVAQVGDVRQEDRREDRQGDRREDRRSNEGGQIRGLDRADQVAGEHGQLGRDNARAVQMDRPNRQESVERPQRSERPERPQRPELPERLERSGRH